MSLWFQYCVRGLRNEQSAADQLKHCAIVHAIGSENIVARRKLRFKLGRAFASKQDDRCAFNDLKPSFTPKDNYLQISIIACSTVVSTPCTGSATLFQDGTGNHKGDRYNIK